MSGEMRLNLNFLDDDVEKEKVINEKIKDATKRKKQALETIEEAWGRLLSNAKLTDKDREKMTMVKRAMQDGLITRENVNRAFSKAEALRLYKELLAIERVEKLKELVNSKPENYILVKDENTFQHLKEEIKKTTIGAFDIETYGEEHLEDALDAYEGKVAGFSFSNDDFNFYLPLNHIDKTSLNKISDQQIMDELKQLLEESQLVMHNAPFDCKWMALHYGIDLSNALYADTRIMSFMLDENRSHRLKDLATDWLGIDSDTFDVLFDKTPFNEIPLDIAEAYAAKDTAITLTLFKWIMNWFEKREDLQKIGRLTFDVEMPVCREFIRADIRGIHFDTDKAKELDQKFEIEEADLQAHIFRELGKEINLSSPTQLKEVLYKELKLSDLDKGSTGVKTLKKIKSEHPSISYLLEFRELSKLRSSFTQSLPKRVRIDGKIHPSHNSLGAKTGRFTCKNPNLQQVPSKRSEVRKLFLSGENRMLFGADLSQIELRIAAVMADETIMLEAFKEGRDLHSTTASTVFNIPYEQIEAFKDVEGTDEWKARKVGKTLNFAVLYGVGAKGLAEMLGCTTAEAQVHIDNFFAGYKKIAEFMENNKKHIIKHGYTADMFGRKRRFKERLKKANHYEKFGIYRQGNNFPIQSSAGVVLKKAIVELQKVLPKMDVFILLQIHDELIFDVPKDIKKEDLLLIKHTIENCIKLPVPLKSDIELYPERWTDNVSIDEFYGGITQ